MNNAKVAPEQWAGTEHPLINTSSRHYQLVDGTESILLMEQLFTIEELKAWAKITSYKYRFRVGKKDDDAKDIKKMKTYEAYYKALCEKTLANNDK
jgi:hypothetical protein